MSAPKTNIEKQKKRHFGPLLGMIGVVAAAIIVMLVLTFVSDDISGQETVIPQTIENSVDGEPAQSN